MLIFSSCLPYIFDSQTAMLCSHRIEKQALQPMPAIKYIYNHIYKKIVDSLPYLDDQNTSSVENKHFCCIIS